MGCIIEFTESLMKFEFSCSENRQSILMDMLIRYGDQDVSYLSLFLGIPEDEIREVAAGQRFLAGEQAHDLSQMFLMFFGQAFFSKFTLIRRFYN